MGNFSPRQKGVFKIEKFFSQAKRSFNNFAMENIKSSPPNNNYFPSIFLIISILNNNMLYLLSSMTMKYSKYIFIIKRI